MGGERGVTARGVSRAHQRLARVVPCRMRFNRLLLLVGLVTNGMVACADGDSSQVSTGYEDGAYHCCAEGEDTAACCADYDVGMCYEHGGLYGACREAGEEFEAKVICSFCCEGTEQREPAVETTEVFEGYPAGCGPAGTESVFVCVACGDGVCGPGEGKCVCPEDCAAR